MDRQSPQQLLDDLKPAFAARDRLRINAIVTSLLDQDAPVGNHWRSFAEVMLHNGELHLARRCAANAAAHQGNSPGALFEQASVLARTGLAQEARQIVESLPQSVPDPAGNAFTRGMLALNLGDLEAARGHFRRGVAIAPASGQLWLALAMSGKITSGDADAMIAAERGITAAPPLEQTQYHYAKGKLFDERGEPAAAFASWSDASALGRRTRAYDVAIDAASATGASRGFDAAAITAFARSVDIATDRPIFVTGSPRSGTTLVEQILASHSAVVGGAELGRAGLIADRIGGDGREALDRWQAAGHPLASLSRDYLHLFSEQFGSEGRAVDKTPDASRHLGLLASILPQARFIWMRRNRLDTALSCFRNYFLTGADWSFDLADIARHFRLEDGLLDHWQIALGERLLVVDYEGLVEEPATETRRILAHCGLGEEPAVFQPHKTERLVTTSSVTQVRQPINRSAVGSAQPYFAEMQPFIDTYRALGGTID